MKKIIEISILIVILFLPFSLAAQDRVELKVLCYNLRFGELASLEELAEFIKQENPDLVALQEVDVNTYRERAVHQNGKNFIAELAYLTNTFSAYGKTIPYRNGYYGIGILSKYPIVKSERILLPMPEGAKEQRAYLVNEIELPNGELFNFVCTHLDYVTSFVREEQLKVVNEDLLNRELPSILCGDFNARPDSKEISEGMKMWTQMSTDEPTIPAENPKGKIDYIFCYPQSSWQKVSASTPKVQLSDHLPVVATIELIIKK